MADHSSVHPAAAEGFESAAQVYEQVRPSYPKEVIEFIHSLCPKADVIVDLGAGTGKFTRLLAPLSAREIIAVEPVKAMREHLQSIPIITQIIDGSAEKIPLEDSTADILFCAQSYHWFANVRALAEIHRVLKPNGLFVLIWNAKDDDSSQWRRELTDYVESFQPNDVPRYKTMKWKKPFEQQTYFGPLEHRQWANRQRANRQGVINGMLSISFIGALPIDKKNEVIAHVQQRLDAIEEFRNNQEIDVEYLTNVFWCFSLKSS